MLLTGWNPPKKKYSTDTDYGQIRNNKTYFGECQIDGWVHSPDKLSLDRMDLNNRAQRDKTKGKIANGCIFGGRTGYSVKMVHPRPYPKQALLVVIFQPIEVSMSYSRTIFQLFNFFFR